MALFAILKFILIKFPCVKIHYHFRMASPPNEKCVLRKEEFTTAPTIVQMKGFNTILRINKEKR